MIEFEITDKKSGNFLYKVTCSKYVAKKMRKILNKSKRIVNIKEREL